MTELPDELKDQSTSQPISILRTPQPFIQSPTKFLEHTDVPLVSSFVLLGFGLFVVVFFCFKRRKKRDKFRLKYVLLSKMKKLVDQQ